MSTCPLRVNATLLYVVKGDSILNQYPNLAECQPTCAWYDAEEKSCALKVIANCLSQVQASIVSIEAKS